MAAGLKRYVIDTPEPFIVNMAHGAFYLLVETEQEPRLKPFAHDLDDILRRKDHTGTEQEEKIIADASLMSDAPGSVFGIFADADFPYPDVTLADGKTVKLDKAAFSLYRAVPNREDRKKVFTAYLANLPDDGTLPS